MKIRRIFFLAVIFMAMIAAKNDKPAYILYNTKGKAVEYADLLKAVMLTDKKEDLKTYKDQVKDLLRLEIVSRYYYQKGKVLASLHTDTDIADAKHILYDPVAYAAILNGSYIQPDHAKLIKEDDAKFLEESSDE